MKSYLILVRGANAGFEKLDEAGQGAVYEKWGAYMGKLTASGNWVNGAPLNNSGRLLCEKKEPVEGIVRDDDVSVGGYMTLKAEDYDEVLRLCDDCPTFDIGGKLEIREILEM